MDTDGPTSRVQKAFFSTPTFLSATGQKMLTVEAESDFDFIPKDICFLQFLY